MMRKSPLLCYNRFMKKIVTLLVLLFILFFPKPIHAQDKLVIDFYWKTSCQYCEKEQKFLDQYQKDNLTINQYNVSKDKQNAQKLVDEGKRLNFNANSVPTTIIKNQVILGFDKDDDFQKLLEDAIKNSDVKNVRSAGEKDASCTLEDLQCETEDKKINIPLFGTINTGKYSLPLLTVILGLADGFNPCAMWALIALIGLLITLQSRKKLLIIAGTFLFFSYLVYVIFMTAWLNMFLYLSYIKSIQIIIGIIAIVSGLNYIRDFFRTDPQTCKIIKKEKRNSIIFFAKKAIAHNFLPLSIIGVLTLAIAVNTIEALCSVGIPTIYTKLLSNANLNKFQYTGYIGAYNIFYMLDDIIVFFVAVFTRQIIHPSPKIGYYARLIGGLVLAVLGIIFIIKPELLSL